MKPYNLKNQEILKYDWYYDKGKFNKIPIKKSCIFEKLVTKVAKIVYSLIK